MLTVTRSTRSTDISWSWSQRRSCVEARTAGCDRSGLRLSAAGAALALPRRACLLGRRLRIRRTRGGRLMSSQSFGTDESGRMSGRRTLGRCCSWSAWTLCPLYLGLSRCVPTFALESSETDFACDFCARTSSWAVRRIAAQPVDVNPTLPYPLAVTALGREVRIANCDTPDRVRLCAGRSSADAALRFYGDCDAIASLEVANAHKGSTGMPAPMAADRRMWSSSDDGRG
jgi:hypothetical protein